MNSLSFVLVVLGVVFSTDTFAQTYEQCKADCDSKFSEKPSEISACITNYCSNYESQKDIKQACSSAYEKWENTVEKNKDACSKFTNGRINISCEEAVNKCKDQVSSAFGQTESKDENIDSLIKTALGIVKQYSTQEQAALSGSTAQKSCYSFTNKDVWQAQKDHEKNIQEINDKIKKAKEKINDDNKKLSEKTAEIKKSQTQLNNDLAKAKQEIDVKKREKFTAINEEIQKSSTSIRNLGNIIVKEKRALEKVKFDHQNAMLMYTQDKIDSQCQTAIDQAKKCFVKNSKKKSSTTATSDPCNNEVYAFSGKGSAGTTALKKRLQEFASACYENLNTTVSNKKYEYADKVKEYDLKIKEYQEQIADANKALELKNQEFNLVTKEFETELTNTEKNIQEQITNLTTELSQFQKDIDASIKTSEAEMKVLNDQLAKLQAVSIVDDLGIATETKTSKKVLEFTFTEAEDAINANEKARSHAADACGCSVDDKGQPVFPKYSAKKCSNLIMSAKTYKPTQENQPGKSNN